MFYCEECRKKNHWPESIRRDFGPCEVCGKTTSCHDVPSSQMITNKRNYKGEFYFSQFSKKSTKSLEEAEKKKRNLAEKHQKEANRIENEADYMLYELNYRKHIKVLKPLREKQNEISKIINDPSTSRTRKQKAEIANARAYKAFWYIMKYGKDLAPGDTQQKTMEKVA